MGFQVLDPTNESVAAAGAAGASAGVNCVARPSGFISNGKEGTKGFFAHLDRMLREEFGVANVVSRVKSNYSAPADGYIVGEIANWDAVVTGIGD